MASYTIGRNPTISKVINWLGFGVGGCLFFANIHFSAEAMQALAAGGSSINTVAGVLTFSPAAAGDDFMGYFSRYSTALSVSLFCLLISGCLFHPAGLPTVFSELRNIRAGDGSKPLSLVVTILVLVLLSVGGFYAYRYDLATTQLAFNAPVLGVASVPVWINVIGPELFLHGTHFYGRLISADKKASPSGSSGLPFSFPFPIPGQGNKGKGGKSYNLK